MTRSRSDPAVIEAYMGVAPWLTAPCSSCMRLDGFYGESQVLHGVDLAVQRGEIVTIVGRNGAGKTTTLRAVMGILRKAPRLVAGDGSGDHRVAARKDRASRASATCRKNAASSPASTLSKISCLPPR